MNCLEYMISYMEMCNKFEDMKDITISLKGISRIMFASYANMNDVEVHIIDKEKAVLKMEDTDMNMECRLQYDSVKLIPSYDTFGVDVILINKNTEIGCVRRGAFMTVDKDGELRIYKRIDKNCLRMFILNPRKDDRIDKIRKIVN